MKNHVKPDAPRPPRFVQFLLKQFHPANTFEEVDGDLDELYQYWVLKSGRKVANLKYLLNVLSVLPPFVRRRKPQYAPEKTSTQNIAMIRNYLKISFRNLKKQGVSTAINVVGLSIGIATCVLIMLYVKDELSFDRFNEKADRIYRVGINLRLNGRDINGPTLGSSVAGDLKNEFPEVEQAVRIRSQSGTFVSHGTKSFKEENILYTDSSFFQVFTIPLLKGNPQTALKEPNTVVLTEETAKKYFGNADPIGQILIFGSEKTPVRVTGVTGKVPDNSHFTFDLLASTGGLHDANEPGWLTQMNFYTYLLLPENYDYKQLEPKLLRLAERYVDGELQKYLGLSLKKFKEKGDDLGIFLLPMTDIHLRSAGGDLRPTGDVRYLYVLSAIAAFMLLIACVNFMNLSTATALKRSREIGVRKVLGSLGRQLREQFLVESGLMSVFALFFGLLIVALVLPYFNELTGKILSVEMLTDPFVIVGLIVGTMLTGLLAGGYPAFYLASFKPVLALKGKFTTGKQLLSFRSGLVVFQFFVTIALIIATITADRQLRFMQSTKTGFEQEQVLVVHDTYMLGKNENIFRQKLLANPQVILATQSGDVPVGATNSNNSAVMPKEDPNKAVVSRRYFVDEDYLSTLGMHLALGRNFSSEFPTDSAAVILNETAVKALGLKKNPIGRELVGDIDEDGTKHYFKVIGVVRDFHFESLRQKITPLVMFLGKNSGNIIVKSRAGKLPDLLSSLKIQWESFSPGAPFSYTFLDDRFEDVYRSEQKTGQILTLASGLTIFIACLGLFGLAAFTAEQRTKEIGVRKVLGASVGSIIGLLSTYFLKLILIALLVASPVAWYAMNQWLADFAYKTSIEWWIFACAGLLAAAIALLTVSFQSVKAALMNPIKSLRSE